MCTASAAPSGSSSPPSCARWRAGTTDIACTCASADAKAASRRRSSTSCAPTGAAARPSSAGRRAFCARCASAGSATATASVCTPSTSSPTRSWARASTAREARSASAAAGCRHAATARSRSSSRASKRGRTSRTAVAWASATAASGGCVAGACATCARDASMDSPERCCASASTPPRALSRSTSKRKGAQQMSFTFIGGRAGGQERAPDAASPLARLSDEQIEQIGREFDAIHDEVFADLGERDARYIRNVIKLHRGLVLAARALLMGSRRRPLWLAGTAALSVAKILEDMEIGHNVLHGQWDWMNDPYINSRTWDWDTASPAEAWRHSHNYEHHTFTNIRGKDRDLGYEIMRIDPHQRWHPVYLLQPLYNLLLMAFFEWGVALHDLNFDAIRSGEKSREQVVGELKDIGLKARRQVVKDYIAFPLLSGRSFKKTLAANFTANVIRNAWAHAIIFCGHFPDQTYTFSEEEVAGE